MKNFFQYFLVGMLSFFVSCSSSVGVSYYPLQEGVTYVYKLSMKKSGVGSSFKIIVKNLPARQLNGKKVIPQQVNMDGNSTLTFIVHDKTGIYEYARQGSGETNPKVHSVPEYYLKEPLKPGATWRIESKTSLLKVQDNISLEYTILSFSEVITVPAGTFNNCIRIKASGNKTKYAFTLNRQVPIKAERHIWYAPGVGIVKLIYRQDGEALQFGSGSVEMQLVSYEK